MEVLVLNGKKYVKASKAALDLGYTSDYVGQLCRSGNIDAHLVGRSWYVDADALSNHRVEKKRMSRVKAREQAHKSIEEHRQLRLNQTKNAYKNVDIHYESDDAELIPAVRKLEIGEERKQQKSPKRERVIEEEEDSEPYEVLNEGEKILMSGKLKIVDASEDFVDESTTVLKPKLIKHPKTHAGVSTAKPAPAERALTVESITDDRGTTSPSTENQNQNTNIKKDFLSKLEERDVATPTTVTLGTDIKQPSSSIAAYGGNWMGRLNTRTNQSVAAQAMPAYEAEEGQNEPLEELVAVARNEKKPILPQILIVTAITVLIMVGMTMIDGVWSYSYDTMNQTSAFDTSYVVSPQNALEIPQYIVKQ